MLNEAITAFVMLFVVIDPIGLGPMFVALTRGASPAERRRIALTGTFVGAAILTVFGLAGDSALKFIGISMPAFRISGGLLLFLIAVEMVFEKRTQRREEKTAHEEHAPASDPSVFPLGTPLLAGPAAIATMILLVGEQQGDLWGQAMMFGVLYALLLLALVSFLLGGLIERALGRTGVLVVTRLFGMLLAALSVQFVLDGLADYGALTPG
ncbi:MAG TPA: MarC family protein [Thermohalobaculum sp.]|nr:MarC family protein [Thermohalobaculum sp.]